MSRILIFEPPAYGHVNPSLPVVQELVRRGHEVIYYNHEGFRELVEATGATFRAYPDTDMTPQYVNHILKEGNLAAVTSTIMRSSKVLIPFTLEELEREKADLVIIDAIAVWARIAVNMRPHPCVSFISFFFMYGTEEEKGLPVALKHIPMWLSQVPGIFIPFFQLWWTYGYRNLPDFVPFFPLRGEHNIFFTSKELHPHTPEIDDTYRFVGPSIPKGTADAPFFPEEAPHKIYISLGTIHGRRDFFQLCFETFADHPGHFILSTGSEIDPETVPDIPDNFSLFSSVPQVQVLQECDVFITHGGMNSIHESLYYGIPLLLVPQQFEQLFGARAVVSKGAGILHDEYTHFKVPNGAQLRKDLDTLLRDDQYREKAAVMQEALRKTGGFSEGADVIERHIRESQGETS